MTAFFRIVFIPLTLIRFIIIVLVSLFFFVCIIIEDRTHRKPESYKFWSSRYWAKSMLFVLGIHVKHNRRPEIENYLLMPNHRSWVDILVTAAYSPSAFVSKAEVASWPMLGPTLKAGKAILVQRDKMQSLIETMQNIAKSIENGISVTVFPEGTTSNQEYTLPFKNGTFKVAAEHSISIIPCAIEYKHKQMHWVGKKTFLGHFVKNMWRPINQVEMIFGKPYIDNDFIKLRDTIRNQINSILTEIRKK